MVTAIATQHVVVIAAGQDVETPTAINAVAPVAAHHHVGTIAANDHIVAAKAVDYIVPSGSDKPVVTIVA
ncbi:hypothetical protein [Roseovarius sp. MMSF_3305]|uniref:hypothetical protein n=1 Tax=Roseovarius sp. MMSF_3305 TaxID=3046697 RepID=UPI00353238C5